MSDVPSVFVYSVNLSDAKAPEPLPIGEYRAAVKGVDTSKKNKNDQPMAVISYHVSPDQYPIGHVDGNADGETFTDYFSQQDDKRGQYRAKQFCERHGIPAGREIDFTRLFGLEVIVKVSHEIYNGEKRARAQVIRPA